MSDWARLRVVERVNELPGRSVWLLARRSISDPTEIKYYLSNGPTTMTLPHLARKAATRYEIEQCIEEAKDGMGLDQHEVRLWPSWHRHTTLVMMAHAWLTVQRAADAPLIPDEFGDPLEGTDPLAVVAEEPEECEVPDPLAVASVGAETPVVVAEEPHSLRCRTRWFVLMWEQKNRRSSPRSQRSRPVRSKQRQWSL